MVVRDVVEELLSVQSSTKEESKVAILSFDDLSNERDCLSTVERVLICQTIFDPLGQRNDLFERACNLGQERGIETCELLSDR